MNWGILNLAHLEELEDIEEKLEEIDQLKSQLAGYEDPQTESDLNAIQSLAEQISQAQDDLAAIPLTFIQTEDQQSPGAIEVTVSSKPSGKQADIEVTYTNIRSRPGNPADTLGTISTSQGTTEFTVTFTPNGNYGTATFRAKAGGKISNSEVLTITGECREEAQERLQEYLARLDDAATFSAALGAALGSLTGIILGAIASLILVSIGLTIPGLNAIIAIAVIVVGLAIFVTLRTELLKKKEEIKKNAEEYIELLPPCS